MIGMGDAIKKCKPPKVSPCGSTRIKTKLSQAYIWRGIFWGRGCLIFGKIFGHTDAIQHERIRKF